MNDRRVLRMLGEAQWPWAVESGTGVSTALAEIDRHVAIVALLPQLRQVVVGSSRRMNHPWLEPEMVLLAVVRRHSLVATGQVTVAITVHIQDIAIANQPNPEL